ncbi:glycosyltransferase family 2 protein [Smaragdicoccus niigatensis]|uniref:glycosyltransferase family 2 protein n=1 Tax=Smaragdicoccus niigatensis TaxID=359359 RepID=UPI00036E950A|nr:glycosyltransferase family 2 protein [Smaragdicoccus niigatensis]
MRVLVAIPTRDRPRELRRCVDSVLALVPPPDTIVSVLVVDNGSAVPAVSLVPAGVTVVVEPAPGFATVRNRILDYAEAENVDLLAFIDDDETCDPQWLTELVGAHRRTGADAVTGPVRPEFDGLDVSPALASYFEMPEFADLSERPEAYTGNIAFARSCFAGEQALRFDPTYDQTGGEDTDFTRRLTSTGRRIVFAASAIVHDHIPPERLRWRWVLSRHVSYGERKARIALSVGDVDRFRLVYHGVASVGFCALLMTGQLARRRSPLTMLRPGLFGVGCIRQAVAR